MVFAGNVTTGSVCGVLVTPDVDVLLFPLDVGDCPSLTVLSVVEMSSLFLVIAVDTLVSGEDVVDIFDVV